MKFAKLMGIVPLGIGLTVIVSLWGAPWNEFGSPPLVFRVFGSFIALAFLFSGAGLLFGKLPSSDQYVKKLLNELRDSARANSDRPGKVHSQGTLKCPNCGSSPSSAEVSPHGDVKCDHCSRWYNVHAT